MDISGTGFGEIMYFINPSMTYALDTATYYVDCAFAVILYKGGWIFGFLYFLFVFRSVHIYFIWSKKTNDNLFALTSVLLLMLVVSTMLMTAQVIHTYAINTFVWSLIGIANKMGK